MNKFIKYVSVVAYGNFNPSIITPDFLNNECKLNLGEPTGKSLPSAPVVTALKFQNIDIQVVLERCQISEHNPENLKNAKILNIFSTIYDKLKYTPLSIVGININSDISYSKKTDMDGLLSRIANPETILDFFSDEALMIHKKYVYAEAKERWMEIVYRLEDVGGLSRTINVFNRLSLCNINYNYETKNLHENKNDLNLLLKGYDSFCDEFHNLLEHLGDIGK